MTEERKKSGYFTVKTTTGAMVHTHYCARELDVPPESNESLRLAGRGR